MNISKKLQTSCLLKNFQVPIDSFSSLCFSFKIFFHFSQYDAGVHGSDARNTIKTDSLFACQNVYKPL